MAERNSLTFFLSLYPIYVTNQVYHFPLKSFSYEIPLSKQSHSYCYIQHTQSGPFVITTIDETPPALQRLISFDRPLGVVAIQNFFSPRWISGAHLNKCLHGLEVHDIADGIIVYEIGDTRKARQNVHRMKLTQILSLCLVMGCPV